MTFFSIGEIAEKAGIAASAIRYYEQIGLLTDPPRSGGQRRYDASILQRLSLIQLARQAGFSLKEIQLLMNRFPEGTPPLKRWQAMTPRKLKEIDALLKKVQQMRTMLAQTLTCNCSTLDDCVTNCGGGESRFTCGETAPFVSPAPRS